MDRFRNLVHLNIHIVNWGAIGQVGDDSLGIFEDGNNIICCLVQVIICGYLGEFYFCWKKIDCIWIYGQVCFGYKTLETSVVVWSLTNVPSINSVYTKQSALGGFQMD